jgi:hypothetical protein
VIPADRDVAELLKWGFSMFDTARFVETDEPARAEPESELEELRLLVAAESEVEL